MSNINMGRVVVGGLLAGLAINIGEIILNGFLLADGWERVMRELGKPQLSEASLPYFVVSGFVLGILAVWLYAAIRPRFGAGVKTAICAGLAVWALAFFCPNIGFAGMGLFPRKFLATGVAWGFIEAPLATVLGAWIYKED